MISCVVSVCFIFIAGSHSGRVFFFNFQHKVIFMFEILLHECLLYILFFFSW